MPHLMLPPKNDLATGPEPSSDPTEGYYSIPLWMDLSMHALPAVILLFGTWSAIRASRPITPPISLISCSSPSPSFTPSPFSASFLLFDCSHSFSMWNLACSSPTMSVFGPLTPDFLFLEKKYKPPMSNIGAPFLAVSFGAAYCTWVEHCATMNNGKFPYPFLTIMNVPARITMYTCSTLFALVVFWGLNRVHR